MAKVTKSETIAVNVTPVQKKIWKDWADKKNKTVPEFVRDCVETYILMMDKLEKSKGK